MQRLHELPTPSNGKRKVPESEFEQGFERSDETESRKKPSMHKRRASAASNVRTFIVVWYTLGPFLRSASHFVATALAKSREEMPVFCLLGLKTRYKHTVLSSQVCESTILRQGRIRAWRRLHNPAIHVVCRKSPAKQGSSVVQILDLTVTLMRSFLVNHFCHRTKDQASSPDPQHWTMIWDSGNLGHLSSASSPRQSTLAQR